MRAGSTLIALALSTVIAANSLMTAGCAAPATPASVAAAVAAPPPVTPPTSATTGTTTIVAVQPAPAPAKNCSLCSFLGLDKIGAGIGGLFQRAFSRIKSALGLEGRFPGLQPKPPILSITDPANLGPTSPPAVKAAAEAKMEEDQAGQKVQALRYLATIGCGGCYPGIEEAMLAALDDCTEVVRYEAVLALRGDGNTCCAYCRCQSCCSPAVRKKLDALANSRDDQGCYLEPSERVRRMARVVLGNCGGLVATTETAPSEGPTPAPPIGEGPTAASGGNASDEGRLLPTVQLVSFEEQIGERSVHDTVLARVNGEEILESQLLPIVDAEIADRRSRGEVISPEQFQAILNRQVGRAIDAKLLLHQARVDYTAAGRPFGKLTSEEVDEWLKQSLSIDSYVSLTEMNAYYQAHPERFQGPPEVRWEQFTIFAKDKAAREQASATAEYLRRRAMGAADAVPPSDLDLRMVETTTVEYTTYDRVEPQALLNQLKSLPVGVPSPVIARGDEFYVVRVLDRRAGKSESFDEAMTVIRKEVMAERQKQAEQQLLVQLRQGANVWTLNGDATAPVAPTPIVQKRKKFERMPNLSPPTPIPPVAAPKSLPNITTRRIPVTADAARIQQAQALEPTAAPPAGPTNGAKDEVPPAEVPPVEQSAVSTATPAAPADVQDRGFPTVFATSGAPRPKLIPLPPVDGTATVPIVEETSAPAPASPQAPLFPPPARP